MSQSDFYYPHDVKFSRKVAVIPPILSAFSHKGQMRNDGRLHDYYVWIERGQDLAIYFSFLDKTDNPLLKPFLSPEKWETTIPSPVSGLLLHANYYFGKRAAILVPEGEPEPMRSREMFSGLIKHVTTQKKHFLRQARTKYQILEPMTEAQFNNYIDQQVSQEVGYEDVSSPYYIDYLNDAKSRHASLRYLLKDLV